MLRVAENLMRTRDSSLNYSALFPKSNVAISGVILLTFMAIDLFLFSFSDTQAYQLCPPEFWDNILLGVKRLGCPFVDETNCATVPAGGRIVEGSRVMDTPTDFFTLAPWGTAHGSRVHSDCGGCRVVLNAEFRIRRVGASLRRVFAFLRSSGLSRGRREEGQSGALRRWSGIPGRPRPGSGRSSTSGGH